MIIKGYREVSYFELISLLKEYRVHNKKSNSQIAVDLGFRASQTIVNALNYTEQKAKDLTLTKVMKYLEFDGFILFKGAKKYYYINNNIK